MTDRCSDCYGVLPCTGGRIPVQGCACGHCRCQSCVRERLGLPSRQAGGGVLHPLSREEAESDRKALAVALAARLREDEGIELTIAMIDAEVEHLNSIAAREDALRAEPKDETTVSTVSRTSTECERTWAKLKTARSAYQGRRK